MSLSSRSVIALLVLGISLGACDKRSAPAGQVGEGTSAQSGSGEVPAAPEAKAPAYRIDRSKAGSPLPTDAFADEKGQKTSLARFRGHPLLVNLWATWCAPCVAELPQLDALAGKAAGAKSGLAVVAVSQDSQEAKKVLAFFDGKGFRHIRPWLDPDNALGLRYGTGILPTSVLYDAKGREVARIIGAPDWTGPEAQALLRQAGA